MASCFHNRGRSSGNDYISRYFNANETLHDEKLISSDLDPGRSIPTLHFSGDVSPDSNGLSCHFTGPEADPQAWFNRCRMHDSNLGVFGVLRWLFLDGIPVDM